jgi:hypothetical protein
MASGFIVLANRGTGQYSTANRGGELGRGAEEVSPQAIRGRRARISPATCCGLRLPGIQNLNQRGSKICGVARDDR